MSSFLVPAGILTSTALSLVMLGVSVFVSVLVLPGAAQTIYSELSDALDLVMNALSSPKRFFMMSRICIAMSSVLLEASQLVLNVAL